MIWKQIKSIHFFPTYCPNVVDWRKKVTGKNGRGNPLDFTPSDKAAIKAGVDRLCRDLKKGTKYL